MPEAALWRQHGVRRRVLDKAEAEGDGGRSLARFLDLEDDFAVVLEAGGGGELQRIAGGEVHEEETRPRISGQVAEGVEHRVARVVGQGEAAGAFDADEAGHAPAVRRVRATFGMEGRDEQ